MKNKKMLIFLVCILIIILILIFIIIKNFSVETVDNSKNIDITPEEEISQKQLRETSIALYFIERDTQKIKCESKHIDSISLINNPYEVITKLLLAGPESQNLKSPFPDNTNIITASINNHCIILNFSTEITNIQDDTQRKQIIDTLLNTFSQLNEANSLKIQVNSQETNVFDEEYYL